MKLRRALVVVGLLLATLTTDEALAAENEPIVIGVPIELTGRFAGYGSPAKRGVDLALERFGPSVLGRPIQALYVDVQSNPQVTVSAFTDLLSRKNVRFIIGPLLSMTVASAIGVAKRYKPVWIVPGATTTIIEREMGSEPWFFHAYPYDYHYHKVTAEALKNLLPAGRKKIAIVYDDGPFGTEHVKYARKYYAEAGFAVVAEEIIKANGTDYTAALTRVKQANPDMLVGLVTATDGIVLTKQIRETGIKAKLLVAPTFPAVPEWAKAVGDAGEGWVGVSPYISGIDSPADKNYPKLFPATAEWDRIFKEKFGRDPSLGDVLGYQGMAQLLIAIQEAGTVERDKVIAALKKLRLATPMGILAYRPSGEGTENQGFDAVFVFQRQRGKMTVLYPKEVATGQIVYPNDVAGNSRGDRR
jgi:branched-chain amino acid transport system substrate-binding protein